MPPPQFPKSQPEFIPGGPKTCQRLSGEVGPKSPLRNGLLPVDDPPPPPPPPLALPSAPLFSRARIAASSLATAAQTEAGELAKHGVGQLMITELPQRPTPPEQCSAEFGRFKLCGSWFRKRKAEEFLKCKTLRYPAPGPTVTVTPPLPTDW